MNKLKRNRLAWLTTILSFCVFMVVPSYFATAEGTQAQSTTQMSHNGLDYFVPGQRIQVKALVTDAAGIMLVRCYFRAKGAADFNYVDMPLVVGNEYAGILPAPAENTDAIEYCLLAFNGDQVVVKSQNYTVSKKDGVALPAWQQVDSTGQVTVKTELAQTPQTIPGFADNINTSVTEPAMRVGYIVDGLYPISQMAGSAPPGALFGGQVNAASTAAPEKAIETSVPMEEMANGKKGGAGLAIGLAAGGLALTGGVVAVVLLTGFKIMDVWTGTWQWNIDTLLKGDLNWTFTGDKKSGSVSGSVTWYYASAYIGNYNISGTYTVNKKTVTLTISYTGYSNTWTGTLTVQNKKQITGSLNASGLGGQVQITLNR